MGGVGGVEDREPGAEREPPPPTTTKEDVREGESWLTTRARDLVRVDCLLATEPVGAALEAVRAALELPKPLSLFTSRPRSVSGSPVAARLLPAKRVAKK